MDIKATHAPIELEAQLTYATAMMAACIWLIWQIADFTSQTGWDGLVSLMTAIAGMSILEIVVLGLALHIFYRGHWMAIAMVLNLRQRKKESALTTKESQASKSDVSRKNKKKSKKDTKENTLSLGRRLRATLNIKILDLDDEKDELERLEVLCVSFFYRTFRFLHSGLLAILALVCIRLGTDPCMGKLATLATIVFIYIVSGPVLRFLGWLFFFAPIIKQTALRWDSFRDILHRKIGLWHVGARNPHFSSQKWHHLVMLLVFITLTACNMIWVSDYHLQPDKWTYVRSQDERVLLHFRMGAIQSNYYVETKFRLVLNGRLQDPKKLHWYPAGPNRFLCSLPIDEITNGACTARLTFQGYTVKGAGMQGSTGVTAETKFIVLE